MIDSSYVLSIVTDIICTLGWSGMSQSFISIVQGLSKDLPDMKEKQEEKWITTLEKAGTGQQRPSADNK